MTDPNTVSTGVPLLDAALGGLFWGDNVVWELDEGGSLEPFVAALLRGREQFDRIVFVRFDGDVDGLRAANAGAESSTPGRDRRSRIPICCWPPCASVPGCRAHW